LLASAVKIATGFAGLLDATVLRNAYGRQLASDVSLLRQTKIPANGDGFYRPIIERVGSSVEVLATTRASLPLVRKGSVLAATFHPNSGDTTVHEYFLALIGANRSSQLPVR
jgi:5'-phosphate synthase pdxT subunit